MPTVLFTAIGRRVQLVRHFQMSGWNVIGADTSPDDCATRQIVTPIYHVPSFNNDSYFDTLLAICQSQQVDYLIPLYEPELVGITQRKNTFMNFGVRVIVSNEISLDSCLDKFRLSQHLSSNGFLTPVTYIDLVNCDDNSKWIIKPRRGMGSRDVYIVDYSDLQFYYNKVDEPIVQRFIEGQEYSIDAYVDSNGQILSVVPRLRLEVRSGEVSKSVTVEDGELIDLSVELLKQLALFGPVTLQGIKEDDTGKFYFIEVNPRFGGGVPLTIQSGIPYADFIAGKHNQPPGVLHPYQSGLKMLRYDEAVYVTD